MDGPEPAGPAQYVLYALPAASSSPGPQFAVTVPVASTYTQPFPAAYAATNEVRPRSAPTGKGGTARRYGP